jgi:hypothetical protein
MSEFPLSTHAGPIAVISGGLFAVAHAGMFVTGSPGDFVDGDPGALVAMMSDPLFLVFNAAYAITFSFLLIALVALYWRQARESGRLGAIAFCTAATGTVALAGDMWFEGFAAPWLAQVSPDTFGADRAGTLLEAAWFVSVFLFSVGWALFGLASLRARVLPPVLSVAVGIGGLIGFLAASPPWGVVLGSAVAAAGGWLVRQDRTVRDHAPSVPDVVPQPR